MKAYQFKIAIKNSKPPIWRRCIVPAGITFSELSEIFVDVMGWNGCHLSKFEFKNLRLIILDNCREFIDFNSYMYDYLESSETIIDEFVEDNSWFTYTYDFGDEWQHRVTVEKVIENYEYNYPLVIKYKGDCPIEDCGGILGYYHILNIINDKNHPEYDEYMEFLKVQGYPKEYRVDEVNDILKAGGRRAFTFGCEDNTNIKFSERANLIMMCFAAAEVLYGIVPSRIIVKMYNNCCSSEEEYIDAKILKEELRLIPKEYINFEYVENQYVSYELLEDDSYKELLGYQGNKEFYIPSRAEIEQLSEHEYIADEPMLRRLQMFLVNRLGIDNARAEMFSGYVQRMLCDGYDMQEVLDFFEINHILVSSEKQLKELVLIFNDLWNDTRMKINRGYKPNELAYNNKIKITPENSKKDNIIDFEQRRKNKIYPNDLCPCGSGKKYKKCCGRNKKEKSEDTD